MAQLRAVRTVALHRDATTRLVLADQVAREFLGRARRRRPDLREAGVAEAVGGTRTGREKARTTEALHQVIAHSPARGRPQPYGQAEARRDDELVERFGDPGFGRGSTP